jgi:hypothetical protein
MFTEDAKKAESDGKVKIIAINVKEKKLKTNNIS